MNRAITARGIFIFHKVGQGLFYSGTIQSHSRRFDFVYDCGSERINQITREVRNYKQNILPYQKRLDMLIISHLHKDHVNGLNELLDDLQVDYVFLPYLLPVERLILALMHMDAPAWYFRFLHDPVTFLIERRARTVILIGGEGPEEEGSEGYPDILLEPRGPEIHIKLKEDNKLLDVIKSSEDSSAYSAYINNGRLLIKSHSGYVQAIGLWLFKLFNYKIFAKSLNSFQNCVSRAIPTSASIKDAIRIRTIRDALRKCYDNIKKDLGSDFNNTSLLLYHTPIGNFEANASCRANTPYCRCLWHLDCILCYSRLTGSRKLGQFLTGDINLNRRYVEISTHFRALLDKTIISLVPHHGAQRNWNNRILRDLSDPVLWVASAGLTNRYGHPRSRVIHDICIHDHYFMWVNEGNELIIKVDVTW